MASMNLESIENNCHTHILIVNINDHISSHSKKTYVPVETTHYTVNLSFKVFVSFHCLALKYILSYIYIYNIKFKLEVNVRKPIYNKVRNTCHANLGTK